MRSGWRVWRRRWCGAQRPPAEFDRHASVPRVTWRMAQSGLDESVLDLQRWLESLGEQRSEDWSRPLVIDHSQGWTLDKKQRLAARNHISRLRMLYSGMTAIAKRVADAEAAVLPPSFRDRVAIFSWNVIPGIHPEQLPQLACDFDAFSVHASAYVRITAWIWRELAASPVPQDYVGSVLGPVRWHRDKVAAHLAAATYNSKDTDAQRAASGVTRLAWRNGRLWIGGEGIVIASGAHDPRDSAWALTEVFGRLRARFWPQLSESQPFISVSDLPPIMSVALPPGRLSFPAIDTKPLFITQAADDTGTAQSATE